MKQEQAQMLLESVAHTRDTFSKSLHLKSLPGLFINYLQYSGIGNTSIFHVTIHSTFKFKTLHKHHHHSVCALFTAAMTHRQIIHNHLLNMNMTKLKFSKISQLNETLVFF